MTMYTDPSKARAKDPGHPEPCPENPPGCAVFALHKLYSAHHAARAEECIEPGEAAPPHQHAAQLRINKNAPAPDDPRTPALLDAGNGLRCCGRLSHWTGEYRTSVLSCRRGFQPSVRARQLLGGDPSKNAAVLDRGLVRPGDVQFF